MIEIFPFFKVKYGTLFRKRLDFFYKNNNIAVVMFIMISDRYTLHFLPLKELTNGTFL